MNESDHPGLIGELLAAQRAYNEWYPKATPEERVADARASLRLIAEYEEDAPDWYKDA